MTLEEQILEALKELAHQVRISNAVDDHGHELKNLKALHDAERVLAVALHQPEKTPSRWVESMKPYVKALPPVKPEDADLPF
jgi:hypothetical protein